MSFHELIDCCALLDGSKAVQRRNSASRLIQLISNKKIAISVTAGKNITWNAILQAVHGFLIREAEEVMKRNSADNKFNKKHFGDYLIDVVLVAHRNGYKFDSTKLLNCVFYCFDSVCVKKYFSSSYIVILRDGVLNQKKYWGEISSQQWLNIFLLLKDLIKRPYVATDKVTYVDCMYSFIKNGPLHKFSAVHLRQEFKFFTELCQNLDNVERTLQIHILNIVTEFCKHTAKDCRMACCKLGEDIFDAVLNFCFKNAFDKNTKLRTVELLLLQVNLHHPNGVLEGDCSAFAVSWVEWHNCMKSLFQIVNQEMDLLCSRLKKNSAFICNLNSKIENKSLDGIFVMLAVEVFRQVFNNASMFNAEASFSSGESTSQPAKRRKLERDMKSVIDLIQETKDWPWINVLNFYLKKYPKSISCEEFQRLLQVLSEIQAECKDVDTLYHLYKCLSTLIDLQKHLNLVYLDDAAVKNLWSVVWDSTIRAAGLNQNVAETNKLIQKLIVKYRFPQSLDVFRAYFSGVLKISEYSLRTLETACQFLKLPDYTSEPPKKTLLNLIVTKDNCNIFSRQITARVLVFLILKQCPEYCEELEEQIEGLFKDIEHICDVTASGSGFFEGDTISDSLSDAENKSYILDKDILEELVKLLDSFGVDILEVEQEQNKHLYLIKLVNTAILFTNVISEMLNYKIITPESVLEFCVYKKLVVILEKFSMDFQKFSIVLGTSLKLHQLNEILKVLEGLFSCNLNVSFTIALRNITPTELIKSLFDLLDREETAVDEDSMIKETNTMKALTLRILCNYCCVPGSKEMTQFQTFAFTALANTEFKAESDFKCQQKLEFLSSLKNYTLGTLNDLLNPVIQIIQNICETKYTYYDIALKILHILYDLYPHMAVIEDEEVKSYFVNLLFPFFELCEDSGPQLAVAVLNCMGQLAKVHPRAMWTTEGHDQKVSCEILRFIKSDFQEVRLTAVNNLSIIFNTKDSDSQIFFTQKYIFDGLYNKCIEAFRVETDGTVDSQLSEERRVDETVTRTASVLHTYGTIIAVSNIWRSKALFSLIRIVDERCLSTDSMQKVLKMTAKHLGFSSTALFLEKYFKYLIENWFYLKHNWHGFPYSLLGCASVQQFSSVSLPFTVPLAIRNEGTEILQSVAEAVGKTVQQIVEKSFPKIISGCLPILIILDEDYQRKNKWRVDSYKNLENILGLEKIDELYISKLDDVIVELATSFYDEVQLRDRAVISDAILFIPETDYINNEVFLQIMTYLECKISNEQQTVLEYCMIKWPGKIQKILLNLAVNMHSCQTKVEMIRAFCHYSLIVDLLMPHLDKKHKLTVYLVRDIIYTVINIINNKIHDTQMSIIACNYLNSFLSHLLSVSPYLVEKFLFVIVSALISVIKYKSDLNDSCLKLLNYLIVENISLLADSIKTLDPFPLEEKYEEINTAYKEVKYGENQPSLKKEMEYFLNAGNAFNSVRFLRDSFGCNGFRTEALRDIKRKLSKNKEELKVLYSALNNSRGFSEDTKESVLHQFVHMLVKLTSSNNNEERLEAAACLGELGPADLTTLVLQREKLSEHFNSPPLELITAHVTALCLQYIIHSDISVVQATSSALYKIMDSKEGGIVAESSKDYGCGVIEHIYLLPFKPPTKRRTNSKLVLNESLFTNTIDNDHLWSPSQLCSHSEWITSLVTSLLKTVSPDTCYLQHLIPVCEVQLEFSESVLPLLVNVLISAKEDKYTKILRSQFNNFFTKHWEFTTVQQRTVESNIIPLCQKSVECMLNVVNFLRLQNNAHYLKLNYLYVAQAAKFCSAHFSVLLYSELWSYEQLDEIRKSSGLGSLLDVNSLDIVCQNQEMSIRKNLQDVLKEAYTSVGDLDALRGIGSSYLLDKESQISYYKQLGRWEDVLTYYDVQMAHGISTASSNLMSALKNCNLYKLPLMCETAESESSYECLWRLGQWCSSQPNMQFREMRDKYQQLKYFTLKAVHEDDWYNFKQACQVAHHSIIDTLNQTGFESCKNLYGPLSELQCLKELNDFAAAKQGRSTFDNILDQWKMQDDINRNEFQYVEPIKAQRVGLFRDMLMVHNQIDLKDALVGLYLDLAELARKENQFSVATRALKEMQHICDISEDVKLKILMEEAQICWANNDCHMGRQILRQLLNFKTTAHRASILKLYGSWMIETRSQSAHTIIKDYLLESLKLDHTSGDIEKICDTYITIARFADKEYQQVVSYIKSSEFERKIETMNKSKSKAAMIKQCSVGNLEFEEKRAIAIHERQSKIDEHKINSTYEEKNTYLLLATKYYLRILQKGNKGDMCIFRLLSLWLENRTNTEVMLQLKDNLTNIPSYKYISILPQLVPHITSRQDDDLSKYITLIIERCMKDHPHHTIPPILALINADKDSKHNPTTTNTEMNESRVQAARELVQRAEETKHRILLKKMMEVADALIELAYWKNEGGKGDAISPKLKIRNLKNLDDVLVPTYTLAVKRNCDYSKIVGIQAFSSKYSNVGGINAPKQITCTGTDGKVRFQLVKGQDDLRQDSVMQQVFTIMNGLLAANKQTNKLLIRTYKVVPLSMRSGILEWVENTNPIGKYLEEAHEKYKERDHYTARNCREKLKRASKGVLKEKLQVYEDICKHFPPVFHKYFETSFLEPAVWHERRRLYMNSVATTSMCGYILGIGDRHVQNILIDNTTAEVIHIDFGIAFDQGQVLPTPETVPFRLTRDIEDGMGICGIEGVFRRVCERTMEVLRHNSETIIAILEVLLYDPLYTWTVSPAEAYSRQREGQGKNSPELMRFSDEDEARHNVTAERALLRLKEKLQGREDGSSTSVEGQVEKLLQQARDPANLCQLFNGWQAYF